MKSYIVHFHCRAYKTNRRSVTFDNDPLSNRSRFGSRFSLTSRRSGESNSYQVFHQRWSSLNRNITRQIEAKADTLKRQFKNFKQY